MLKFNVGSQVFLKRGILMKVERVDANGLVHCVWSEDGGKEQRHAFPASVLLDHDELDSFEPGE